MTRRILYAAGLVALLLAIPDFVDARGLECADRISSHRRDAPASGHLIGTTTVTETTTYGMSGSAGTRSIAEVRPTITKTTSSTYQIGTYEMEDGQILEVDCRNYMIRR